MKTINAMFSGFSIAMFLMVYVKQRRENTVKLPTVRADKKSIKLN